MNMLNLNRQKHNEPDFDELSKIIADLKDFLNEDVNPKDKIWGENFKRLMDFQDTDGSFKLFDSYQMPSEAIVDFCFIPTYISTAILIKAYLTNPALLSSKEESFKAALEMSSKRNLKGHGFEAFKGQIEALNIFKNAGLREFIDLHSEICPQFSEMIEKIIMHFHDLESQNDFQGPWNESYEQEILEINRYFSQRNVFVYGTLMEDEVNHHYLENSTFLGKATITGYDMYDVGCYPAITQGDNLIIGELYEVPINDIPAIDSLEGEGELYIKKCETVNLNGKTVLAFVYIYLEDCTGLEKISAWKKEYVWYVSYGSNMLKERFLYYIKGGSYRGSRYRSPCSDTTQPLAVKSIEIPYGMYFGNTSGSWEDGGVSFLDITDKGSSLGVAYLITKEQFEHVSAEENSGRVPTPGYGWYEDIIDLGYMDGFEVKTITNKNLREYNEPCSKYMEILFEGIKENWPEMSDVEIENYLKNCIR